MKHIAIFASGNGTNAENIIKYFQNRGGDIEVSLVVCNRREAGVYERVARLGMDVIYMPKSEFNDSVKMSELLNRWHIDFIVLAGFLLMIPAFILKKYPNKIINLHPSLLPKYGGKGMYGQHVHKAVVEAGEKETGITIHFVNELCDEGEIIFQAKTDIDAADKAEDVEKKIHVLEKKFYPEVIDMVIQRSHQA